VNGTPLKTSRCIRGSASVMRGIIYFTSYYFRSILAINKKETSEKEEMQRKMFLLHKWSILKIKVKSCLLAYFYQRREFHEHYKGIYEMKEKGREWVIYMVLCKQIKAF
jgi:hypothetical protein